MLDTRLDTRLCVRCLVQRDLYASTFTVIASCLLRKIRIFFFFLRIGFVSLFPLDRKSIRKLSNFPFLGIKNTSIYRNRD